jgi:rubrerythrin
MMMEQAMTSVSDVYRGFIPSEHGTPLDEQIFPWSVEGIQKRFAEKPLSMEELDLKTVVGLIAMETVETQNWRDYLAFATIVTDERFKKLLNSVAWAEHLHLLKIKSLLPSVQNPAGLILLAETAAILGYNAEIQNEPNDTVKSAFQHIVPDHKEHAEFLSKTAEKAGLDVKKMTGGTDFSGGRPFPQQFMKPDDTIWQGHFDGAYKKGSVNPQTLMNIDLSQAVEKVAWDAYMSGISTEQSDDVRMRFAGISSIENEHGSILASLRDPTESILEKALVHEKVEMQFYGALMDAESNPTVRKVFQDLYREDLEQARLFGEIAG